MKKWGKKLAEPRSLKKWAGTVTILKNGTEITLTYNVLAYG